MNITKILDKKYPGTEWVLHGETYDGLEWLDQSPKPSESELEALAADVEYEAAVEEVEQLRYAAYSDRKTGSDVMLIKAQLGEDGITLEDVKARKAEIRAQYPMPENPAAR